jgi:hypothetical protein
MIKTSIINESPYASAAAAWDKLLVDMERVERTLGWRYIWEGGYADKVSEARREADATYRRVIDWEPSDVGEVSNRVRLMEDLCAYERAFYRIGRAILKWPLLPSHAREPKLARLVK